MGNIIIIIIIYAPIYIGCVCAYYDVRLAINRETFASHRARYRFSRRLDPGPVNLRIMQFFSSSRIQTTDEIL